jgi:hypothetical protein
MTATRYGGVLETVNPAQMAVSGGFSGAGNAATASSHLL